jgi:hypothetical protein
MRALTICAVAGSLAACSIVLRLDMTRAADPERRVSRDLTPWLQAYRDELERTCTRGLMAVDRCQDHRRHLLDLFDATDPAVALDRLEATVDATDPPEVRARFRALMTAMRVRLASGR